MNIGILYIGIGPYYLLWEDFFRSAEKYLFPRQDKIFYLFTDQEVIPPPFGKDPVRVLRQEDLGGYRNTLYRFHMFWKYREALSECDYLFFFNGDTVFKRPVAWEELLPSAEEGFLTGLSWHIYFVKRPDEFPYDRNPESAAYIPDGQGTYYYQGGLNGGRTAEYLALTEACMRMVEHDQEKGLVAKVNDESHLNKYLLDRRVKTLGTVYGRPERWFFPLFPKIIFRDKRTFFAAHGIKHPKDDRFNPLRAFVTDAVKYVRFLLR